MHLLAAKASKIAEGEKAIDLDQSPAEIIFLSAADTELSCMAAAYQQFDHPAKPDLRLANITHLQHPYSVDLYLEKTLSDAKVIVIRLLGGLSYWRYGVEEITALKNKGVKVFLLPGDDKEDEELRRLSTSLDYDRIWSYFREGGIINLKHCLELLSSYILDGMNIKPAQPLPRQGLYWPGTEISQSPPWKNRGPIIPILFYRALIQSGAIEPIDRLIEELEKYQLNPLPIYVQSLKEPEAYSYLESLFQHFSPSHILNSLSFALNQPMPSDCPILQIILSGQKEEEWRENSRGLTPRELAMQVALPEIDGKILTRAISFKAEEEFDQATQYRIHKPKPQIERIGFVAKSVQAWVQLQQTNRRDRNIGIILANYPNRDGRLGNGVGLDVPQSLLEILSAMQKEGYDIPFIPEDTKAAMNILSQGVTNQQSHRLSQITMNATMYQSLFDQLPSTLREAVTKEWGAIEQDPFFHDGAFQLAFTQMGKIFIGIQPARGYQIDPVKTYHDPELVPPHYYLAFYFHLQQHCQAVIHLGKHGTMEWLPGKALALSSSCWPEIMIGHLPHLYPFIVNDPGEGTQAKRRSGAVIIDHMTPILTQAETYGDLAELERLVDEYYEAAQLDPRRLKDLTQKILERVRILGLDKDCGINAGEDADQALVKIDNHLCELKELQIRDGLHIFGHSTEGMSDLLLALTRFNRVGRKAEDRSILRALADDLALNFDPLSVDRTLPWQGARPEILNNINIKEPWRHHGDTLERLEKLALSIISGTETIQPEWQHSRPIFDFIEQELRPLLRESAKKEIISLLKGLDGKFVSPGPSGAPSRGRLDILPTGRNFYSVDTRAVPTPSAWALGWKSAYQLLEHHKNIHGAYPRSFVLSVWGTSNMRTGGDDIAQALAFLGVRPLWEIGGRVDGFEILPLSVLGRPRVDVTLRISGFFRDAFPAQIDLFDQAVRAVGALDEPFIDNPIAEHMQEEIKNLAEAKVPLTLAQQRAGHRIFGARPGAYGTGLQAMLDENLWSSHHDLGKMFIEWGSHVYGGENEGQADPEYFSKRLSLADAVLHNQDNREHDILDSDDYYQFEGGLTAAIRHLTDRTPAIWHNDHSNIEAPKSRSLEQELGRIVRGRAANPKWIKGVMRHGYKGAAEMAATVDYLYAFAATTGLVSAQHFAALYDAYLQEDSVRDFIAEHNPAALKEMAGRFLDAIERGLWQVQSNSLPEQLKRWMQ